MARFSLANVLCSLSFRFELFAVCGPCNQNRPETKKTAPARSRLNCFSNKNMFANENRAFKITTTTTL